jgi:hypothetical protein
LNDDQLTLFCPACRSFKTATTAKPFCGRCHVRNHLQVPDLALFDLGFMELRSIAQAICCMSMVHLTGGGQKVDGQAIHILTDQQQVLASTLPHPPGHALLAVMQKTSENSKATTAT